MADFGIGHVVSKKLRSGAMEKLKKGERKTATTGLTLRVQLIGGRDQLIQGGWLKVNCGNAGFECWGGGDGYFGSKH